jgi:formate/nitrite transporter FocA (FNT family)
MVLIYSALAQNDIKNEIQCLLKKLSKTFNKTYFLLTFCFVFVWEAIWCWNKQKKLLEKLFIESKIPYIGYCICVLKNLNDYLIF